MADNDVDLFVIGAGSGGARAARIASSHGARVMIAEAYRIGGTCVIRGCVPKKLLVYASAAYGDDFEDAAGFGWTLPEKPTFDWPTLGELWRTRIGSSTGSRSGLRVDARGAWKVEIREDRAPSSRMLIPSGWLKSGQDVTRRDYPRRDRRLAPSSVRRSRALSLASPPTRSSICRAAEAHAG